MVRPISQPIAQKQRLFFFFPSGGPRSQIDTRPNKARTSSGCTPVEHDSNRGPGRGVVLKYSIALLATRGIGPLATDPAKKKLPVWLTPAAASGQIASLVSTSAYFGSLSIFDINVVPLTTLMMLPAASRSAHRARQGTTDIARQRHGKGAFCLDCHRRGPSAAFRASRISDRNGRSSDGMH